MKKTFFAVIAMTAILASCSKNTDIDTPETTGGDSPQVQITLGTEDRTRAFFDDTATAEPWENEITSLEICVFGQSGNYLTKHNMTASEIAAKSANVALPHSATGTSCTFFVSANTGFSTSSFSAMDNFESNIAESHNGTFAEVSSGHKRESGFMMTGKVTATIAGGTSYTPVSVPLKRIVAKVAVRTSVDPAFTTANNGATVIINSAKIDNAPANSFMFYRPDFHDSRKTAILRLTQDSHANGNYRDNLFYISELGQMPVGNRVNLTLTGYFDADGNTATTADRQDVEYNLELDGAGNGEIKRNGYYRVNAIIKGLPGDGVSIECIVSEWETPVTQTVNLGA